MTQEEFKVLLSDVRRMRCETQTLEIKKAKDGVPTRLYDTLSSFSNQDDGGIILFGIDENAGYQETGVYDAQDLQKLISEQCRDMEPPVRPLLGTFEVDGRLFVTAEIPGIDLVRRPCFYRGKGRLKGSYIRVGDSDEPMTEYEIYSYEAYKERYQDDVRTIDRVKSNHLDQDEIQRYIQVLKRERSNFSRLTESEITELTHLTRDGLYTFAAVMVFGTYPQSFFPQLCVTAVRVPGLEIGDLGLEGERFLDNQRLEGNIRMMFDEAMQFVQNNMRVKTIINPQTGHREDRTEYPLNAVREAILNALVHRDYSRYSEGMPIQILMFADRMEIKNPGGLYGRIRIDQLGKVQPDTRNPALVTILEAMNLTENRYSGIPTIRRDLHAAGLPAPEFLEERGSFIVRFRNAAASTDDTELVDSTKHKDRQLSDLDQRVLEFCRTPRTRQEISRFLGIETVWYAISHYVMPLVEQGLIELSQPERLRSRNQTYLTKT